MVDMSVWGKAWMFKLPIKGIWKDQPSDIDDDTWAKQNAGKVAAEIRKLMERTKAVRGDAQLDRMGDLYIELDEIADLYEDIDKATPESWPDLEASEEFNDALAMLYDLADRGKRIWIE